LKNRFLQKSIFPQTHKHNKISVVNLHHKDLLQQNRFIDTFQRIIGFNVFFKNDTFRSIVSDMLLVKQKLCFYAAFYGYAIKRQVDSPGSRAIHGSDNTERCFHYFAAATHFRSW
jgi:hypothetical protein